MSHNGSKPDIEDLKEKGDVKGLIKALQYKKESTEYEDYEVRRDAAEALGDFEEEKVIKALTHAFKDVEDVRFHVARNLGKFEEPAVPYLLDALKDPDEHVRRYAAWILGVIGDDRAVPALENALNDPSDYVRKGVEQALRRFG